MIDIEMVSGIIDGELAVKDIEFKYKIKIRNNTLGKLHELIKTNIIPIFNETITEVTTNHKMEV